ncbi:MAG: adenylyltransferase/cytidyltransferase family protein [Verrucomicrobia bacterium]|nr:adenylyltransferase/cytidyltransferase family protein [Verrucomicrobiota bacterium]MBU1909215.1 adenylyltransferase/cytidyltransferase family protein [Verrucomicrobiota bacterium]
MAESKILDLDKLAAVVTEARAQGKVVVHCHGVFDLLHIGHIRYFEQARQMGDLLIVTLTPDGYVDKGPHRPAFNEELRAEAIASLSCVDYVALNRWPTAEETLRLLRPDIYVKGAEFKDTASDMTGKIGREEKVIHEIGARLAFTEDIVFSSSHLINTHMSLFPVEVKEYLQLFKSRYTLDQVLQAINRLSDLKVLVIGDTIIDTYVYCEAIGKSSKDPVLALRHQSEDSFAGGVLAVANHVANFAGRVELFSVLGTENSRQDFVTSSLAPNVTPHFFMHPGAPTIVKQRFLEGYSLTKLMEVYYMDEAGIPEETVREVVTALRGRVREFDMVVVADYGHGMMAEPIRRLLCEEARFLAVNTQANAGNRGFNTITRYPRVDFGCIAEHEMRLEMRDAQGELRPMIEKLAPGLQAKVFVVTRGKKGALIWNADGEFMIVPAFAMKVVDRVGAGDAFLSVAALAACIGAPSELLGLLGNVAGAQAVEIIGNKKAIDKLKIQKTIVSMLK